MKYARIWFLALTILVVAGTLALAARPGFVFPGGCCYYNDTIVRTVVPPAAVPKEGIDAFYAVMGGAEGQKGVVAVAPGDPDYHGGHWKFHVVMWHVDVEPYLLTSEEAVLMAEDDEDVMVMRVREMDFKCPIQP